MKKGLVLLLVFISLGLSNVYALESENVIDGLEYLSESDLNDLQQRIDEIKEMRQLEAVIVMTQNTEGKSSMVYADDYFDYNNYGVGDDHSGLLLLVNMDARELWISTTGHAIDIFTDRRIADMIDEISPYLSDENYDGACQTFLDLIDNYAIQGVPSGQYRVEAEPYIATTYGDRLLTMMTNGIVYIAALVIAIVATVGLTLSRKGKVTINNLTYEEKGSFILTNQQDDFIREAVIKTKIETSSGGGNGSSTHSGSSGSSHGGGGGKF